MLKYFIVTLVLAATAFGAFQNCSDNEFQSVSGSKKPETIGGGGIDPEPEPVDYQLINYPTDHCVNEGESKTLTVDIVDGSYKHNITWKKVGSDEVLSTNEVFPFEVTTATPGFYIIEINDGYKKEERKFNLSLCTDPVDPPVDPPVEPPQQCTPPVITAPQPSTQISFEGEERWIGYEVTGDPKPTIKWYFYKNPGESASEIFPDVFDHYYDFKPILEKDEGYYYIVADNGCGDPVESPHYHLVVNQQLSGNGSGSTDESGAIIGWVEDISINSLGKLYAKGWACSKNYNESIIIKIVAQAGSGPMEKIAKFKTDKESRVHELCFNKGADLHGFQWTSENPALAYKGKTISIIGVHPSGNSGLDRELKPKKLEIK